MWHWYSICNPHYVYTYEYLGNYIMLTHTRNKKLVIPLTMIKKRSLHLRWLTSHHALIPDLTDSSLTRSIVTCIDSPQQFKYKPLFELNLTVTITYVKDTTNFFFIHTYRLFVFQNSWVEHRLVLQLILFLASLQNSNPKILIVENDLLLAI